jgi:hypothetical protein
MRPAVVRLKSTGAEKSAFREIPPATRVFHKMPSCATSWKGMKRWFRL